MNTPGSLSIASDHVRWSKALRDKAAEAYLSVIAIGILAGIATATARTPLHLPGHKAIFWIAPLLATRLVTRARAGASVGAFTTALTTLTLGGRIAGGFAMIPLVALAGIVLDMAVEFSRRRGLSFWNQLLFLAAAGALANLICFVKRLFDPMGDFFSSGNLSDMLLGAASHALFGFLAALLGTIAGIGLRSLRPKKQIS